MKSTQHLLGSNVCFKWFPQQCGVVTAVNYSLNQCKVEFSDREVLVSPNELCMVLREVPILEWNEGKIVVNFDPLQPFPMFGPGYELVESEDSDLLTGRYRYEADLNPENIEELILRGWGAIKNDSSPTNYKDPYGTNCIKKKD